MKEFLIKLNNKEVELIKKTLENHKVICQIKVNCCSKKEKEDIINQLYNIESVSRKMEKLSWKLIF